MKTRSHSGITRMPVRLGICLVTMMSVLCAWDATAMANWKASIEEASRLSGSGEYKAAERVLLEALGAARRMAGQDSLAAITWNNLGSVYQDLGQYEKAGQSYRTALRLWERLVGPEDPALAPVLNNLGTLYLVTNRLNDAEEHFERSLAIRRKSSRPDSPHVGITLQNLAQIHHARGEYEKAERTYLEALELWRRTPEHDPAMLGVVLNNIALIYSKRGMRLQAMSAFEESIRVFEVSLGPRHPVLIKPYLHLARQRTAAGQTEEAERLLDSARSLAESFLPEAHPLAAAVLAEYSELLRRTKSAAQAKELERRVEASFQDHSRENFLNMTIDISELERRDRDF